MTNIVALTRQELEYFTFAGSRSNLGVPSPVLVSNGSPLGGP